MHRRIRPAGPSVASSLRSGASPGFKFRNPEPASEVKVNWYRVQPRKQPESCLVRERSRVPAGRAPSDSLEAVSGGVDAGLLILGIRSQSLGEPTKEAREVVTSYMTREASERLQ